MVLLEVKNMRKRYGKTDVLKGVDMQVEKGAIYGLVGRNGAGKTTLLRQICGLQKPLEGDMRWSGATHLDEKGRTKIGAIIETPALYLDMTAKGNMEMESRIRMGISEIQILESLEQVGLTNEGKKKVKDFSLGMRQRLGIAMSILGGVDLLILDEPTNGLDPQGVEDLKKLIMRLNSKMGITMIVSSHAMLELSEMATVFGIMEDGRIICEVAKEELDNKNIKEFYFNLLEEVR